MSWPKMSQLSYRHRRSRFVTATPSTPPHSPTQDPIRRCRFRHRRAVSMSANPCQGGTDAVAPLDAVNEHGNRAEAVAAISPGDGVLPAGGDARAHAPLYRAGERLRAIDVAVLMAAGIDNVTIRVPRIRIARGGVASPPPVQAALNYLDYLLMTAGVDALDSAENLRSLDEVLTETDIDAVIAIGGTGSGRRDAAVRTLARFGRVEMHGIAVSPGETAAFGFVGARPVLLIPGRLDAALGDLASDRSPPRRQACRRRRSRGLACACCRSSAKSPRPSGLPN